MYFHYFAFFCLEKLTCDPIVALKTISRIVPWKRGVLTLLILHANPPTLAGSASLLYMKGHMQYISI